jgi:signal transduction histidine kinase
MKDLASAVDFRIENPTAEFSDASTEAAFRLNTLPDWQWQNAMLAAVGSVAFFSFFIADLWIVGLKLEFALLLATRCVLLTGGLMLVRVLLASRQSADCDRATFGFYLLFPVALAIIMSVRTDGHAVYSDAVFTATAVIVTIGYYVFTINRVPLQVIGSIFFIAVYAAISIWLERATPADLVTEFVIIGFSNVLGLTTVYRYHILIRRQYAALQQEREAIRHLETSQSELVRAKRALEHAHREAVTATRTKSEFLAHMSHELRTPLNAIIGFSEIMKERLFGDLPDQYRDYAGDINNSGKHLLSLINDILDLSKIEAGYRELNEGEVCVAEMADDCVRLLRARALEAGIRLDLAFEDGKTLIRADGRLVKQILINLVTNGIKFNRRHGSVTISASILADGRYALNVTDTGIGIAEADLPYVTEPYRRADVARAKGLEGTGLGLPLVKAMAELHGGKISVKSTVDEGTSVTVWFPSYRVVQSHDVPTLSVANS